ncbi:MAG: transcription antitermination factor NusB [Lachnospiraceae bacterium]|nr:transcription antitermination factor NusB [Lachnospiraceae bacterium]
MNRREIRERIFKLLFRVEFYKAAELEEQKELFLEDTEDFPEDGIEKDKQEIAQKYDAVLEKLPEIDGMIDDKATGWSSRRMGKVELAIIRLAVYEICFDERIPTGVAINEAVELAKNYGQEGSAAFVNGVLAKFTV